MYDTPEIYNSNEISEFIEKNDVKESSRKFTKIEKAYSFIIFAIAYIIISCVLVKENGIISTFLFSALNTMAIVYLKKKEYKFSRFNKITAGVIYTFSVAFSLTENGFIKFLDTVFLTVLIGFFIYSVSCGHKKIESFLPIAMLKSFLELPFNNFDKEVYAAGAGLKGSKAGSNFVTIVLALIVSIPLTVIVLFQLLDADNMFGVIMGNITGFSENLNIRVLVLRLVFSIPVSCYIFGLFYSNANLSEKQILTTDSFNEMLEKSRKIKNIALYASATPICILYVIYVFSQIAYFISPFAAELPEGYSYAEYARSGFSELMIVAVINLIVIMVMNYCAKNEGGGKTKALRAYILVLCAFTLFIIATAIAKMVMYISKYGLTQLRVYTMWFMILLTFLFVMIIIRQFKCNFNIVKYFGIVFIGMFALLCFSRPDACIAKYNIEMYESGYIEELDYSQLTGLSDDAFLTAYKNGYIDEKQLEERIADKDAYDKMNYSTFMLWVYSE